MHMSKFRMAALVAILVVLVAPLLSVSSAGAAALTAKEKTALFLSNVIGLNLANYVKVTDSCGGSYPSALLQEESEGYEYKASDGSDIQGMAIYDNQYVRAIIFSVSNSPALSNQYRANALSSARDILARYDTFAQTCAIDSPCLSSATAMLNQVSALTTSNVTSGNVKMKTFCSNSASHNSTEICWVYTANDVEAQSKRLSLSLTQYDGGVQVSFTDTWGLYSVASTGISRAEATDIAWQAAQKFRFGGANSATSIAPSWADTDPSAALVMVPGDAFSANTALNWSSGGIERNPLTLYPLWETLFYLNQRVGDAVGVQVGVWGDTQQIAYCSEYTLFGSASPPETSKTQLSTESPQLPSESVLAAVGILIATIVAVCVVLKRRR
jgi:hypothetical protein